MRQARLEVVGVAHQLDGVVLLPAGQLERPGADRGPAEALAQRLGRAPADDGPCPPGAAGERHRQEGKGLLEAQPQRQVIDEVDAGQLLQLPGVRRLGLGILDTLEAPFDCLGVARISVVELDTGAQLEDVGLLVDHVPLLGQVRCEAHLGAVEVDLQQAVEHVVDDLDRARRRGEVRVERVDRIQPGQRQRAALLGGRAGRVQADRRGGDQAQAGASGLQQAAAAESKGEVRCECGLVIDVGHVGTP